MCISTSTIITLAATEWIRCTSHPIGTFDLMKVTLSHAASGDGL